MLQLDAHATHTVHTSCQDLGEEKRRSRALFHGGYINTRIAIVASEPTLSQISVIRWHPRGLYQKRTVASRIAIPRLANAFLI